MSAFDYFTLLFQLQREKERLSMLLVAAAADLTGPPLPTQKNKQKKAVHASEPELDQP